MSFCFYFNGMEWMKKNDFRQLDRLKEWKIQSNDTIYILLHQKAHL